MWAYRLEQPARMVRVEVDDPPAPGAGEVLVRLTGAGICGSDVPKYAGTGVSSGRDRPGPGFPLHEVCGVVQAVAGSAGSAGSAGDPAVGDLVVGHCAPSTGLCERLLLPVAHVVRVPAGTTSPDVVLVQPLATVLAAVDRLGDVRGRSVAVLGLGPIGLLFGQVLHERGAIVTGVDPVDRTGLAVAYGLDRVVAATAQRWAGDGFVDLCVEAVGHQTGTLGDAVRAVGPRGTVLAFGIPDDETYPVPFRALFGKAATLLTGVTQDWAHALAAAAAYLTAHPALLDRDTGLVSHRFSLDRIDEAYRTAAVADPQRRKVVIDVTGGGGAHT